MQTKRHWEQVYSGKDARDVSWYQVRAEPSLQLIQATGLPKNAAIIDIGGGASTLVDGLLAAGFTELTVLDVSTAALAVARARLAHNARRVNWRVMDITRAALPPASVDLWHDRAVFHFFTAATARRAYRQHLQRCVKPGGRVILATFAEGGPEQCSGLPVVRYSAAALQAQLGPQFTLLDQQPHAHNTPSGGQQAFIYCQFIKRQHGSAG